MDELRDRMLLSSTLNSKATNVYNQVNRAARLVDEQRDSGGNFFKYRQLDFRRIMTIIRVRRRQVFQFFAFSALGCLATIIVLIVKTNIWRQNSDAPFLSLHGKEARAQLIVYLRLQFFLRFRNDYSAAAIACR